MKELDHIEPRKYPIATFSQRVFARAIDIFFLSFIFLILGIIIFIFDPSFSWTNEWKIVNSWRYLLFGLSVYLIFFVWMILIPIFFNQQTIGMKILKLKYYHNFIKKSSFIFALIKHDLLVWGLMMNISLILSFFLSFISISDVNEVIRGINLFSNSNYKANNLFFYFGVFFGAFYCFSFFLFTFIIINTFIKSKHQAYHDKIANLYLIKNIAIIEHNSKINHNSKKEKYNLPGEISFNEIEKITKE